MSDMTNQTSRFKIEAFTKFGKFLGRRWADTIEKATKHMEVLFGNLKDEGEREVTVVDTETGMTIAQKVS